MGGNTLLLFIWYQTSWRNAGGEKSNYIGMSTKLKWPMAAPSASGASARMHGIRGLRPIERADTNHLSENRAGAEVELAGACTANFGTRPSR